MKRAILFAIVIMALGVSTAFAAVCPVIQYLGQFDIAQDGAEVARVAAGEDRKVYVADINAGYLKVYYSGGEFIESKKINNIVSVAADGDTVFIGIATEKRGVYKGEVKVYDAALQYRFSLGSGYSEFTYPSAIATDGTKVFVADRNADRIKAFDLADDGAYLFSFGGSGNITAGNRIGSDAAKHFIWTNGKFISSGFEPGKQITVSGFPNDDGVYTIDTVDSELQITVLEATIGDATSWNERIIVDENNTPMPSGIAIHPATGNVYVSDKALSYNSGSNFLVYGAGVHIFNAVDGSFLMKYPITRGYDDEPGQMRVVSGIAIDSVGRVYLTDSGAGTVEVYDDAGNYVCDVAATSGTAFQLSPAFTTDGRFIYSAIGGLRTYSTEEFVEMDIAPASLDYAAQDCAPSPAGQAVTVSNNGQGTMNWSAATDPTWLMVNTTSGSIAGIGNVVIAVNVNTSSLGEGTHTANVTITSEGGTVEVPVTVDVYGPPTLEVTQDGAPYDFLVNGNNTPSSKPLTVKLTGDMTGLMEWSATLGEAWMSMSPTSGPSGTDAIGSINISSGALSGLSSGNYAGNINIGIDNIGIDCDSVADVTVPVGLEYYEGGTIEVTANVAEAGFTVTGPQSFSGTGDSAAFYDVAAGDYTITFDQVQGYLTPASYSLTLSGQESIAFNGDYTDIREDNNIIVTMGGAKTRKKVSISDVGKVFDGDGTALESFTISKKSKGGVSGGSIAASGDIDGDGIDDIVVAGPDGLVQAYTGAGVPIPGIKFYASKDGTGVSLALGDLDGDGTDEIIIGSGTSKHDEDLVWAFSYSDGNISGTGLYFRAYSDRYGVNVSTGDIDGDGRDEVLTTRAGGESVREIYIRIWEIDTSSEGAWNVTSSSEIEAGISFEAADITSGDIDADGIDEILITRKAERSDSASRITAFKADGTQVLDFEGPATGIMIASGDLDLDGAAEVVVSGGQSPLSSTTITIYGSDGTYRDEFKAYVNANIYGATVTLGQTVGR